MAHHQSAKKRIRRNARSAVSNRSRVSRIRTFVKKVETAITGGDKSAAEAALKAAQPELHRGVGKGVLHRNTAARKISRLSSRIKAMG
jgi:small subunit ribosomal protein S20